MFDLFTNKSAFCVINNNRMAKTLENWRHQTDEHRVLRQHNSLTDNNVENKCDN